MRPVLPSFHMPSPRLLVRSRLTLGELLTSLEGLTVRPSWFGDRWDEHPFRGSFDAHGFSLVRRPSGGKGYTPTWRGVFAPHATGVDIRVEQVQVVPLWTWLLVPPGFAAPLAVVTVGLPGHGSDPRAFAAVGLGLALASAVPAAVWLTTAGERLRMIAALRDLLMAEVEELP